MRLRIDYVKHGYGTINDGITVRFQRISRSNSKIKTNEFNKLPTDTSNLYLELYNWYYMPSSVHKVLFHGCDVIKYFDMPIGLLSEEAVEATHNTIRHTRLQHTRKVSRESSNMHLITHLLLSSDPKLESMMTNKYCNQQYCQENPSYVANYILNEEDCEEIYVEN